jgi:hypothetical protein
MLKAAIEKILSLADPKQFDLNGVPHFDRKLFPVAVATPDPLLTHTLTSVAQYLDDNDPHADVEGRADVFIHVENHCNVAVKSSLLRDYEQRDTLLRARFETEPFVFGSKMDAETFMIFLQSRFVDTPDKKLILELLGNMRHEDGTQLADDGVTQVITRKVGVTLANRANLPPKVMLAPMRSFPEIEQVVAPFILRIHDDGGEVMVSLHEADGGAWQVTAMGRIMNFIRLLLPHVDILV